LHLAKQLQADSEDGNGWEGLTPCAHLFRKGLLSQPAGASLTPAYPASSPDRCQRRVFWRLSSCEEVGMSIEIETLVSAIEGGHRTSEALEREIAQVAGVVALNRRRFFLSDLDEAVELPSQRGWNFALSSGKHGAYRFFGACIFKPNSQDKILAHAETVHPAQAVVVAFLKGMHELRRLEC